MRSRSRLLPGAAALLIGLTGLTACGSSSGSGAGDDAGPAHLTVWIMRDSVADPVLNAFRADFEKAHKGTTLDIQIQEWDGIGQKITSALASNDAPDVIEVGNTQVAQYAASGGVDDLTGKVADLHGSDWIPGLADPGKIDGKQYGIPWYAANRVVIYNKDLFAQAGITAAPKTRAEWIADTTKLNTGAHQGIYLPGQSWYAYAGFLWDEGGELATQSGGKWTGGLDTPQAQAATAFYRQLQALGQGPKDSDEAKPLQTNVFAKGNVAQIIATPGNATTITAANPKLKGKIGYFPIPGKTADRPGAVFTGGSDLVIPQASKHQAMAYQVLKALTGTTWQTKIATTMSYVPNRTSLAGVLSGDPGASAMAVGAADGHATPNSPNWAAVEADNPIKQYLTQVLTGADPAKAGTTASDAITKALNTSS
ncbi:N,N'-diacetylchitobiose transport system substrate-binding protein [Actinacidiphila yanglinensis]|uniref:N,N'-diacetylchitobiose transport system substrate-binding protein n=1 Tax=Actinacidiphila yanglinensis TaxID=310779 RepID=A0A1H5XJ99_9ACTN|nr:extracellular solute-binding protein [Actinacidiphila yanglinensis]SEG11819.1 N,N'-diacetylchitobiose transport system substrate-binding protein [Actinacidiphila yanglinensis]